MPGAGDRGEQVLRAGVMGEQVPGAGERGELVPGQGNKRKQGKGAEDIRDPSTRCARRMGQGRISARTGGQERRGARS